MQEVITNKTFEKLKYDLVREGFITYDDLLTSEEEAKKHNLNLGQILIKSNFISEEMLLSFIEAKLHIPYVNLDDYTLDEKIVNFFSLEDAKKYRIIPLFKIEDVLTIAMADPLDLFVLNNILGSSEYKLEPIICSERSIFAAIDKHYPDQNIVSTNIKRSDNVFDWREELNSQTHDEDQAKRIIIAICQQAFLEEIQEIHLENVQDGLKVKFKKGEEILDKSNIPLLLTPLCISQIKHLSGLDSSVYEMPQYGKMNFIVYNVNLTASVAFFPTIKGERTVLKIYRPPVSFEQMPFSKEQQDIIKKNTDKSGIICVFGAETSGKTSVIYSLLSSINTERKNVLTVESVVKYDLDNIFQCELNEKSGFDFSKVVKHIEFQSPDVLYIENIWTEEGINFTLSMVQSGKLIITEHTLADFSLFKDFCNSNNFEKTKKYVNLVLFIHNKNKIDILEPQDFLSEG